MKEHEIESCQKSLLVKTYEWDKKSFTRWLNQKKHDAVLKIGACTAAKHKVIFIMALQMV